MFEKPQYLTKNGYKRLDKNPHKDGADSSRPPLKMSKEVFAKIPAAGKPISDKAAKMIAMVLKDMLKGK
jgi:3-deoxy-D-arabino-heptulosonate 7-phosphate (DAHP) synthase